jgi:hypothetical protein
MPEQFVAVSDLENRIKMLDHCLLMVQPENIGDGCLDVRTIYEGYDRLLEQATLCRTSILKRKR